MDPEPIALTSLVGSVDIENPTYGIGLANHQNTAAGFFMAVRDTLRDMKKKLMRYRIFPVVTALEYPLRAVLISAPSAPCRERRETHAR
jgi:hypothetical protein